MPNRLRDGVSKNRIDQSHSQRLSGRDFLCRHKHFQSASFANQTR